FTVVRSLSTRRIGELRSRRAGGANGWPPPGRRGASVAVERARWSRENSLHSSEFAGNSAFFRKVCAEKAFDSRVLRQNSLRGRAGNFFAGSREYAGNFLRGAGNSRRSRKRR